MATAVSCNHNVTPQHIQYVPQPANKRDKKGWGGGARVGIGETVGEAEMSGLAYDMSTLEAEAKGSI